MAKPAQALTKSIRTLLGYKGWLTWCNRSGAMKIDKRYIAFQEAGLPDLMALKNGRFFCCEVKAGNDRIHTAQTAWLADAEKHGAIVCVARKVEDVEKLIDVL